MSFPVITDKKKKVLLNISFHWWVGLYQPLASDWIVFSISYVCCSFRLLFKIKVLPNISIYCSRAPPCLKLMQCLHKILT